MEYKFRGKTINGDWVYGNLAILKKKLGYRIYGYEVDIGYYISNKVGSPFAFHIIPETVGQYTGLKDCTDKEIYERQKCKVSERYEGDSFYHAYQGDVVYDDGGYCIIGQQQAVELDRASIWNYNIEIIHDK